MGARPPPLHWQLGNSAMTAPNLLTALLSGVLAALFTQGIGWLREWWGETKEGKFAALYLAIALEAYADACSTLIYDSHNWDSSSGNAGREVGQIDSLPDYPAVNWKALGIEDTVAAMSFRSDVDFAQGQLTYMHEFSDDDDIVEQARMSAADMGLAAALLAKQFRFDKKLPALKRAFAEEHLRESKDKYLEQRRKVAERQAADRAANPDDPFA